MLQSQVGRWSEIADYLTFLGVCFSNANSIDSAALINYIFVTKQIFVCLINTLSKYIFMQQSKIS